MRRTAIAAVAAVVLTLAAIVALLLVVLDEDDPDGPDGPSRSASAGPRVSLGDEVETTSGPVRGVTDGSVRSWLGLPYAAPPTGPLRWRAPQPAAPWDDVRDASEPGDDCLQPEPYTFGAAELTPRPSSSEDCLVLNVVRPDDDTQDLPVMVWLHGGGFFAGSGSAVAADSSALVRRGIVVVSVNYRLGRLGFFAHPSLPGGIANFGLLDQVAALQWVRDNVAAFGGDPDNVTVAGGSAGAMSVNALMSMPRADGLFERAISESAPSDARALSLADARRRGEAAFPDMGAARLRALPGRDLLSSTFNTLAGDAPIRDEVLPLSSAAAFARGRERPVPYLLGTTSDEFTDDAYRAFGVDPQALRASLGGERHDTLVAAYGGRDTYDEEVLDDLVFDLPAVERAVTHGRRAPTYRYVFSGSYYSGHGAEAAYVFDTVDGGRDGALSDAVADYWAAFVTTGRPDVPGLPAWPEADSDGGTAYLSLAPGGPKAHPRDEHLPRLGALRRAVS